MPDATDASVSSADPRHRSFHLTSARPRVALEASPSTVASGWVRLIESDGTPTAIRISSITQVIGPKEADGRWVVRLVSADEPTEPIAFTDKANADDFVEDLLHDD